MKAAERRRSPSAQTAGCSRQRASTQTSATCSSSGAKASSTRSPRAPWSRRRRAVGDASRGVEIPVAHLGSARQGYALGRHRFGERARWRRRPRAARRGRRAGRGRRSARGRGPRLATPTRQRARWSRNAPCGGAGRRPGGPWTRAPCARPSRIAASALAVEADSAMTRRGPHRGASRPRGRGPGRSRPGRSRRDPRPASGRGRPSLHHRVGAGPSPRRSRASPAWRVDDLRGRRERRARRRRPAPSRPRTGIGRSRRGGAPNSSSTERPTAAASASAASTPGRCTPGLDRRRPPAG